MAEGNKPFSFRIPVADLPAGGRQVSLRLDDRERDLVAAEAGLMGLPAFTAVFDVRRGGGPLISLRGTVDADVIQECSITLEPVTSHVHAEITEAFTLDEQPLFSEEAEFGLEEADPPEPAENGHIDLGHVATEHLILNLDPYPRAPGASFDAVAWSDGEDEAEEPEKAEKSLFSVLAQLKEVTDKK